MIDVDIALLAPVPEEHLIDGAEVARMHGKVAYGSRAWDVFRELDLRREGEPVAVYIYASHARERVRNTITWRGIYVGHIASVGGAYPQAPIYRPVSTTRYVEDQQGYWAIFWHVAQLDQLGTRDWIDTCDFRRIKTGKSYGNSFTPEGPIIVRPP